MLTNALIGHLDPLVVDLPASMGDLCKNVIIRILDVVIPEETVQPVGYGLPAEGSAGAARRHEARVGSIEDIIWLGQEPTRQALEQALALLHSC